MRTIYHTELKCLAREGLLSLELLNPIPRSNIHRWKHKYNSFGLNLQGQQEYQLMRAFADDKKAKLLFASYVRIIRMALSFTHQIHGFHQVLRENKMEVVKAIRRVRNIIGLKRTSRFFNISIFTFRQWSLEINTSCFQSLTGACNRIFPNQLSRPEIFKLKEMLLDPQFQYWPISSIAYYALKNNLLPLSINTWYKYAARLGITRPKAFSRRKKRAEGIRTEKPNQLWYADITVFVTADNVKHYIYLVADNFSRKIISYLVESKVNIDLESIPF